MSYLKQFQQGHVVLAADFLFHYKELFPSADDFLIWQFFCYQNSSKLNSLAPSEIAEATGKTVGEINQSIENLQTSGLLNFTIANVGGETEMVFDTSPAFAKLDALVDTPKESLLLQTSNGFQGLVDDFQRELGRFLSPFEIEDLQKTIEQDKTAVDLVRAALREAVFNNKTNWKYIQAILRNWRHEGITTVAQVEAKNAERDTPQPKNVTVSDGFLQAMDLWKE